MEKNPHISTLFKRYLANECSQTELDELLVHFGKAHEDAELSVLVTKALSHQQDATEIVDPQIDALVNRVQEKLDRRIRLPKIKRIAQLYKVAAVAFVLITVGIGFYRYTPQSEPTHALTSDVMPGSNRATLQFADGSLMELSDIESGIVLGTDGIKYANGKAIWHKDSTEASRAPQYLVLSTPRGGQYQLTLPDGSKVWLNAASTLKYPTEFAADRRIVELEGEAYFDVKQESLPSGQYLNNTEGPRNRKPFIVKSAGQEIEVLGTQFNVSAYAEERGLKTTLITGQVKVSNTSSKQSQLLLPGDQTFVRGDQLSIAPVDIEQFIAWKEGLIILQQADFSAMIRQIERWYDVNFDIQQWPEIGTLSGEVPRTVSLSEILRVLELNTNMKFEIQGRRVTMAH